MLHYHTNCEIDSDEVADLRMEVDAQRRYERKLAEFPHCADPSHPGCDKCEPLEDTMEDYLNE